MPLTLVKRCANELSGPPSGLGVKWELDLSLVCSLLLPLTPGTIYHHGQFTTTSSGSTTLSMAQRLWQTPSPPSGSSTHPTTGKIQPLLTLQAHLWHVPPPNRLNWQPKSERRIQLAGDQHETTMFRRSEDRNDGMGLPGDPAGDTAINDS